MIDLSMIEDEKCPGQAQGYHAVAASKATEEVEYLFREDLISCIRTYMNVLEGISRDSIRDLS